MMKKLILLSLFAFAFFTARAQGPSADANRIYRNALYLKSSVMNASSYNAMGFAMPITLEYSRTFRRNLSWVAGFSFNRLPYNMANYDCAEGRDCYRNTVEYRAFTLTAKVAYNLRVIREFVFLRFEGGLSATYFNVMNRLPANKVLPSLVAEIGLGFRVSRNVDLLFSPLIISPSFFRWSPFGLGAPTDIGFYDFNIGAFGVCVKF